MTFTEGPDARVTAYYKKKGGGGGREGRAHARRRRGRVTSAQSTCPSRTPTLRRRYHWAKDPGAMALDQFLTTPAAGRRGRREGGAGSGRGDARHKHAQRPPARPGPGPGNNKGHCLPL